MATPVRVLIIDDSEADTRLMANELERGDYAVHYERVDDAETTKDALSRGKWDIILSDYSMPGFSGIDALKLLQQSGLDIPFILVSGKIEEEKAVSMIKDGADAFVSKDRLRQLAPAVKRELEEIEVRRRQLQAEEALRTSEQNFRNSLDNSPLGIRIFNQHHDFVYANKVALNTWGCSSVEELIAIPEMRRFTPESYANIRERREKRARGETIPESYELTIVRKSGEHRHLAFWRHEVIWNGQKGYQMLSEDITERKLAEEKIRHLYSLLFAIRKVNQAIVHVENEDELFQEACNCLVQVNYIRFAWVGLVKEGTYVVSPVAHAGHEAGYLSNITVTWDDSVYGRGPTGTAIKTGHHLITRDIASDTRFEPWRKEALERDYASMVTMPLVYENETIGVLNVYSAATDAFGDEEAGFISEVAGDIAVGVKTLRLQASLQQSLQDVHRALNGTIETISAICELRDPYTAGHESAVAHLASAIATEMGLPSEQVQGIWMAASIHDMGKIAIPAEILSKPRLLADYEMAITRKHPEVAYGILKNLNFPWPVAQTVLQHHERLDGSGYPAALSGEQISLGARILAVADVVEAMSSHRPYRPALGTERALLELLQKKGNVFDTQVVDACVRLFSEKGFRLGAGQGQDIFRR